MSKEINYPIKYAVLELKTSGGWLVGFEDIIEGFIASKCYVVESKIIYHSDGSNQVIHKVVFPFEDISCLKASFTNDNYDIGKENIPSYDACNRPYPIHIVTDLFDSYEKAKNIADKKNEEYKHHLIGQMSIGTEGLDWKTKIRILERKLKQSLELCNLFERLVLEATKEMNISDSLFPDEQGSYVQILKPTRKQL